MKLVFVCLALASSAFAADIPTYYGKVKGSLLTSVTKREAFEFTPGKIQSCVHKVISGSGYTLESFDCKIEGVSLKVVGEGGTREIPLSSLFVFYKHQKGGDIVKEYIFKGDFQEKGDVVNLSSEVKFTLWNYDSKPDRINGFISLPAYSLNVGLHGVEVKE